MRISECHLQAVRNLKDIAIDCHDRFNIFFGENGSGKTSILEGIHILGLGRSFRHHLIDPVISHEAKKLCVFSRGHDEKNISYLIGVERDRETGSLIRCNGEKVASSSFLARLLPLQLIHPTSDELITGSPKLRRQFLDWGVFHVEHGFFSVWKKLQRILKQRNSALKQRLVREQVVIWDEDYVAACDEIVRLRRHYMSLLKPFFDTLICEFLPGYPVTVDYQQGWPENFLLAELLEKSFFRDAKLGYTSYGPHRDDLVLSCGVQDASQVLSRGEQKLVIIALRLAQGKLFKSFTERECLYLLDDYAAELDEKHRIKVIEILNDLSAQVFLTTISYENVRNELNFVQGKVFHVEQGQIKPL